MFVPPYQIMAEAIRPSLDGPRVTERVLLPRAMFQLMLRLLLEQVPFDEQDYLSRNPDVAEAVARGDVPSARQHFVSKGYFEGRSGGCPIVDDDWYLKANADVAREVRKGAIGSARDHYVAAGAQEWRSPSRQDSALVEEWKQALAVGAAGARGKDDTLPDEYLRALNTPRQTR